MTKPSASTIRAAYFADKVYPSQPEVLAQIIEQVTPLEALHPERSLKVLHVPHIDYMRGIEVYGAGYQSLRQQHYDVIFLLGTSHQYGTTFPIFTEQDFDSPFGPARNEATTTTRLIDAYGRERALKEQFLHKAEHSLELQIPFLKYLAPNTPIVPILIGSLHHLFPHIDRFLYEPYKTFIDILADETIRLDKEGKKYLFLAGVDMAHVGKFFGDAHGMTDERFQEVATLDRQYLEYIEALDTEKLFFQIASNNDLRRVCGFSTMMVITDVLRLRGDQPLQALNASYKACYDPASDCCVTISGVGYYGL